MNTFAKVDSGEVEQVIVLPESAGTEFIQSVLQLTGLWVACTPECKVGEKFDGDRIIPTPPLALRTLPPQGLPERHVTKVAFL